MEYLFAFIEIGPVKTIALRRNSCVVLAYLNAVDGSLKMFIVTQNVSFGETAYIDITSDAAGKDHITDSSQNCDLFFMELVTCNFDNFTCFRRNDSEFVFTSNCELFAVLTESQKMSRKVHVVGGIQF